MSYYLISPMSDEPALPDDQWLAAFLNQHGRVCGHFAVDVICSEIVVKETGEDVALNIVARAPGEYARHDLLDALGSAARESLILERLVHSVHGPIENVSTLWTREPVRIRGGPRSEAWTCAICRQFIYYPFGRWYVLQSDLPVRSITLTTTGGILVDESVHARVRGRNWRKVTIRPMPVRSAPRDGFPANLKDLAPEEERRPQWMS